jgi:hypothetical protein
MGNHYSLLEQTKQDTECIGLNTFISSLKASPDSLETLSALLEALPASLRALHKEIFIYIFENLNTKSMVAVIRTCKYFQLIGEYISKLDMDICYIGPVYDDVILQFLNGFNCPFKYILQDKNLGSWVKLKPLIQGIKNSRCFTKALFWVQEENLNDDTLQLLQRFISEYPQTSILFWKGDSVLFEQVLLSHELEKLESLEYICISGGYPSKNWPQFFNKFPKLKCVYLKPSIKDSVREIWTVNTKTRFIMDRVYIQLLSDNIE